VGQEVDVTATLVDMGVPRREVDKKVDKDADKDADFSAYMSARQPALYRTAYLLAGDHASAEDLLQVAFAKLYLSWDRIRDREALDGYVRRIMVNENSSLWRRAWKRREHATDTLPETGVQDAYDDGMGGVLWSFVQTLPPKQRAVVVLRYYEQLSEAEIADVLGISVGTVKSQASRALAGLRARAPRSLNPHESGDDVR
jgi:RNA polymerase sigma-70 factor (sigma-E family)